MVRDEGSADEAADVEVEETSYMSPIASPLIDGKLLKKSLKLLKTAVSLERNSRALKADGEPKIAKSMKRPVKRGVVEVTKSVRKGEKGIVFLASDVYPVEIVAHLPVLCEEKDIVYAYIGSKRTLGAACKSKRPSSVLMVAVPPADTPTADMYEKTDAALRKGHPYF